MPLINLVFLHESQRGLEPADLPLQGLHLAAVALHIPQDEAHLLLGEVTVLPWWEDDLAMVTKRCL